MSNIFNKEKFDYSPNRKSKFKSKGDSWDKMVESNLADKVSIPLDSSDTNIISGATIDPNYLNNLIGTHNSPQYTYGSTTGRSYYPNINTPVQSPNLVGTSSTGGWNVASPDYGQYDSDSVDNIIPVDEDNDIKWNVARITITGDPIKNTLLQQYLTAGWEPVTAMYVDVTTFVLILKRLEIM